MLDNGEIHREFIKVKLFLRPSQTGWSVFASFRAIRVSIPVPQLNLRALRDHGVPLRETPPRILSKNLKTTPIAPKPSKILV
jgi:hypothetical protein